MKVRYPVHGGLFAVLLAGAAAADPQATPAPEDARALFDRGVTLAAEERWAEAEKLFAQSEALVPRASTAYDRALALYRLGRLREMLAELDHFIALSDPTADAAAREAAERLRKSAEAALATLTIDVVPEDATVEVDGATVPGTSSGHLTLLDPGEHAVTARSAGRRTGSERVSLSAGEHRTLAFRLEAAPILVARDAPSPVALTPGDARSPGAEPSRRLLVPLTLTITGLVVLGGSVATGVAAAGLNESIGSHCNGSRCPPEFADDQSRMWRFAVASDILLVTGAVLLGSGIALFVWAPQGSSSSSAALTLSPRGIAVGGTY